MENRIEKQLVYHLSAFWWLIQNIGTYDARLILVKYLIKTKAFINHRFMEKQRSYAFYRTFNHVKFGHTSRISNVIKRHKGPKQVTVQYIAEYKYVLHEWISKTWSVWLTNRSFHIQSLANRHVNPQVALLNRSIIPEFAKFSQEVRKSTHYTSWGM